MAIAPAMVSCNEYGKRSGMGDVPRAQARATHQRWRIVRTTLRSSGHALSAPTFAEIWHTWPRGARRPSRADAASAGYSAMPGGIRHAVRVRIRALLVRQLCPAGLSLPWCRPLGRTRRTACARGACPDGGSRHAWWRPWRSSFLSGQTTQPPRLPRPLRVRYGSARIASWHAS